MDGGLEIIADSGRRRRPEVTTEELLESEIEASTHHPGGKHHNASNKNDDAAHECHHEVNVTLVLRIFLLSLELLLRENTLDSAVGFLGSLGWEDSFDELLDLVK